MTPKQAMTFCQAAGLGIACGLKHRYEWFANAERSLHHGVYTEIYECREKLRDAFLAFERLTACCQDEQDVLDVATVEDFLKAVGNWYAR